MALPKRDERTGRQTIPVNNLFALIIILFIIISSLSSYLTYTRSKRLAEELTGGVAAEARLCVNKQPSINQSCSTTATADVGYYCNVDAADPDNDTLTFYDNTALFEIDSSTGEIIFTPTSGDAGTHSIFITASDGTSCSNSNVSTSFTLTISGVPGPPPGPGGGGGGGGVVKECTPQWQCTPWSICRIDEKRTRTCYSLNNCLEEKPEEIQDCIYLLPPVPRRPRPGIPQYYLCNFDEVDECSADFGTGEDWVYTYKAKDSVINVLGMDSEGMDVSIDDEIIFNSQLAHIKGVDVTGDGVDDFEYILHSFVGSKARTTVRLVKQYEVVVERPVYIERLPSFIIVILMFVYSNACYIFLIVTLLAAMVIYYVIMGRLERGNEEKEQGRRKI